MGEGRLLIQRARESGSLDRLRMTLGLPQEFYLLAVHPVIDAYAVHLSRLGRQCGITSGDIDRFFSERLEAACAMLAIRRGLILPFESAPEELGRTAHRWTYAVFMAALLSPASIVSGKSRGVVSTSGQAPDDHIQASRSLPSVMAVQDMRVVFGSIVPSVVHAWLREDQQLRAELMACLAGRILPGGVISTVISRASGRLQNEVNRPLTADTTTESHQAAANETDGDAGGTGLAPLSIDPERQAACHFMDWVATGIRNGTLRINQSGAPVHFVKEGMLLVSPRIFREFVRCDEEQSGGAAGIQGTDEHTRGKIIQRQVLRAGWHRQSPQGINFLTYGVVAKGRVVSRLCGVMIAEPEQFVSPIPAPNPVLVLQASP